MSCPIAKYFESLQAYREYLRAEQDVNGWDADECMRLLLKAELEAQDQRKWYSPIFNL